jgi:hypothetical protein
MAAGVVVVAALLLAVPAANAAGTTALLPVGEADGVRIVGERGTSTIVFTKQAARMYRRVAGKRVAVGCTTLPADDDKLGSTSHGAGIAMWRVSRSRRPLQIGDLSRGADYCRVWRSEQLVRRHEDRTTLSRELIVSIPLTQSGAVYLDEQVRTGILMFVLTVAGDVADRRTPSAFPLPAALAGKLDPALPPRRRVLVPLDSPTDTPPAGKFGYYSDGQRHAAVVTLSAAGRRLFIEVAADDELHTNVSEFLFGDVE